MIETLLPIIEKICTRRKLGWIVGLIVAWLAGYYYQKAIGKKEKADIIYRQTREVKDYSDSAAFYKGRIKEIEVESMILIWRKDKTIDSLKSIIANERNEDK